uniref:Cleavage inducing molecular chaperone Jiv domain-containing protein n=1 Tax=Eptatretus burgeri TaxID=7764 RepID=A0A8C4X0K7_EPTBU
MFVYLLHLSKQETEDKLRKAMNDFMMKLQKDIDEAVNTMSCVKCGGKHKRYKVERTVWAGRYCTRCDALHGAVEGDLWAESSMLGFKITFYALMDGHIYDVTGQLWKEHPKNDASEPSTSNGQKAKPHLIPSPIQHSQHHHLRQDHLTQMIPLLYNSSTSFPSTLPETETRSKAR